MADHIGYAYPFNMHTQLTAGNAGNAENVKDYLNGLDKAVSAVLVQRTIERNQLLVTIAKSKLSRNPNDKGKKRTKPEELVRLRDLLIQNTTDLTDLVSSGRERKAEEVVFSEEYELKTTVYQILISRYMADNCMSSSYIEHATSIMEEENAKENISKGVSTISLSGAGKKPEKYLLEMLEAYESAVGDSHTKGVPRIAMFPPAFQSVPCNPIVMDIAYYSIEFPSLEARVKKDKKSIFRRFWG